MHNARRAVLKAVGLKFTEKLLVVSSLVAPRLAPQLVALFLRAKRLELDDRLELIARLNEADLLVSSAGGHPSVRRAIYACMGDLKGN